MRMIRNDIHFWKKYKKNLFFFVDPIYNENHPYLDSQIIHESFTSEYFFRAYLVLRKGDRFSLRSRSKFYPLSLVLLFSDT